MRFSILLVVLFIFKSAFCAGPMGMDGMETGEVRQTPSRSSDAREERLRAEKEQASAVFAKLQADLDMVLKTVSVCEVVPEDKISEMERDFIATKRVYRYLEKEQQSDMMLLDAWLSYFKGDDIEEPLKRSERACMLNPTSGDAYASSIVFSVLSGRAPKPEAMILRLAKKGKDQPDPQMSQSTLEINVPDIAIELMGKKLPVPGVGGGQSNDDEADKTETDIAKQDENGTYGCIMIWTLSPEAIDEENVEKLKAVKDQLPPEKRAMLEKLLSSPTVSVDDIKSQVDAFSTLYENNSAKSRVMFLSINIDDPQKLREFIAEKNPQPTPIPGQSLPVLTQDIKKAMKMLGCLTLITDSRGVVRYAGSPEGFLPVMLINSFIPGSQKYTQSQQSSTASKMPAGDAMMGMDMGMGMMPDQPQLPAKQEVKDSNSLPQQGVESGESTDATELTDEQRQENTNKLLPEQQSEAENLLTAARMFRGSHTRLGSSRKVVEDCMAVIEKFPGTTYEAEAKQILDSIPAHQKKKYGIE